MALHDAIVAVCPPKAAVDGSKRGNALRRGVLENDVRRGEWLLLGVLDGSSICPESSMFMLPSSKVAVGEGHLTLQSLTQDKPTICKLTRSHTG